MLLSYPKSGQYSTNNETMDFYEIFRIALHWYPEQLIHFVDDLVAIRITMLTVQLEIQPLLNK